MELGLIWLICVIAATAIGQSKGEPLSSFFVGLIFGPLGVLFALLSAGNRRPCPQCAEKVLRAARICPHCKTPLSQAQDNIFTKWR